MIYCIDTDILIEYFKDNKKVVEKIKNLKEDDEIAITWISFFEFFKGIFLSGKFEEETFLLALRESITILEQTYKSSKKAAEIYAKLKKQGELINDADILIASIVITNNVVLVTGNETHFKRIKSLKIENWLKS